MSLVKKLVAGTNQQFVETEKVATNWKNLMHSKYAT